MEEVRMKVEFTSASFSKKVWMPVTQKNLVGKQERILITIEWSYSTKLRQVGTK